MSKSPQFIVQGGGVHNSDLDATAARLMRGATWKKQRIVVIMPAADVIPARVVLAQLSLAFPPNNLVHRILAQGMEVGDAYSSAIENILQHPELSTWEYILTIEHDNAPPPDGVLKLVERMEAHPEFACVGGLYFTKGPNGVAQIWGDPKDSLNFRPQVPVKDAIVECNGTGMGFNLWRLAMFKDAKLRRPWFKTQKSSSGVATQDLYFWMDARKNGYRCAIDCAVKVGHFDLKGEFGIPEMMW